MIHFFGALLGSPEQLAVAVGLDAKDMQQARNKLNYATMKDPELKSAYQTHAFKNGKVDKRASKFCLLSWL